MSYPRSRSSLSSFGSPSLTLPVSNNQLDRFSRPFDVFSSSTPLRSQSTLSFNPTASVSSLHHTTPSGVHMSRNDLNILTTQLNEVVSKLDSKPSSSCLDSLHSFLEQLLGFHTTFADALTSWCIEACSFAKISNSGLSKLIQCIIREKELRSQERKKFREDVDSIMKEYEEKAEQMTCQFKNEAQKARDHYNSLINELKQREAALNFKLEDEKRKCLDSRTSVSTLHSLYKNLKNDVKNFKDATSADVNQVNLLKRRISTLEEELKLKEESVQNLLIEVQKARDTIPPPVVNPSICPSCIEINTKLNSGISDLQSKLIELESALSLLGFDTQDHQKVDWKWTELGEFVGRTRRMEEFIRVATEGKKMTRLNFSEIVAENKRLVNQSGVDASTISFLKAQNSKLIDKLSGLEQKIAEDEKKRALGQVNFDLITIDKSLSINQAGNNDSQHFSRSRLFLPLSVLVERPINQIPNQSISTLLIVFRKVLNYLVQFHYHNDFFLPNNFHSFLSNDVASRDSFDPSIWTSRVSPPRVSEILIILNQNPQHILFGLMSALKNKYFDRTPRHQSIKCELNLFFKFLKEDFSMDVQFFIIKFLQIFYINYSDDFLLPEDHLPLYFSRDVINQSKLIDLIPSIDPDLFSSFFADDLWYDGNKYSVFVFLVSLLDRYKELYQGKFLRSIRSELNQSKLISGSNCSKLYLEPFLKYFAQKFNFLSLSDLLDIHRFSIIISPNKIELEEESRFNFTCLSTALLYYCLPAISLFQKFESNISKPINRFLCLRKNLNPIVNSLLESDDFVSTEKQNLSDLIRKFDKELRMPDGDIRAVYISVLALVRNIRSVHLGYFKRTFGNYFSKNTNSSTQLIQNFDLVECHNLISICSLFNNISNLIHQNNNKEK
ncbi:hypothetical protein RCL1_008369 [Eukaryota sp. TZLM3-RCL]